MPAVAITGGVASGKSTFTGLLAAGLDAATFDADTCARRLLEEDAGVRAEIRAAFGAEALTPEGAIDRGALRRIVFAAVPKRRVLEGILHPRVRIAWRGWMEERLQNAPRAILLVQIPLLYETGAAAFFSRVIVVGCNMQTQLRRLTNERHLTENLAREIVASQWETSEKIRRCDHLIWNDGTLTCLEAQTALCAASLKQQYS